MKKEFPWGENREWAQRTQHIAALIPAGSSVIDLGCGFCHLKKYLKECTYSSVDIDEWVKGTVVADFNKGEYPELGKFDVIVCQGIIEYIDDPIEFLNLIQQYGRNLIITYNIRDRYLRKNLMTELEFCEILVNTGWRINKRTPEGPVQVILECSR